MQQESKPTAVPERGRMAYMTQPGQMEMRDYELPRELEPGAALLEVLQTNVCGSDIHVFEGRHPVLKCGGIGHEMVGKVLALGSDLATDAAGAPVARGDRVVPVYTAMCGRCENCTRGVPNHCDHAFRYFGQTDRWPHFHGATFATHYYLHPDQPFFRVPDSVSNAAAASANCALAQVLHGLDRAGVGLQQTVVIQGAGGVGLCAAAVAKQRGARVVVMDKVPARLALARAFGADAVIDVGETDSLEKRVALVQQLAQTQGADVVVEATGVPAAFSEGVNYLRPEGTYLVMGIISPGQSVPFDPGLMVRKSARVMGVNRYPPKALHQALQFLSGAGKAYPFDRLLDRSFTLEQSQEAIERSARREVQRATIVIDQESTS